MAILIGAIKYRGSFKSIRNYSTLYDPNIYAGEKGGATRSQILNNPVFARTRENMSEFTGAGMAARALRLGFMELLRGKTDRHFIARLVELAKEVQRMDFAGAPGKSSVLFSTSRNLLKNIMFSDRSNSTDVTNGKFAATHPITRAEATLTVTGLDVERGAIPEGANYFRVVNHLSTISDYVYSDIMQRYEPLSPNNSMEVSIYSEYTPIEEPLTATLLTAFPTGTTLEDGISVIQTLGIEFFKSKDKGVTFWPVAGGDAVVVDVF